ncbi:MAG: C40 family peptidase [Acidobacteriota bacterium]|nr:C40 family peptidase [Acidobacteriota bacterium]
MKKLFPYALVACLSIGIFSQSTTAQTEETRVRQLPQATASLSLSPIDADPVIISLASEEDIKLANGGTLDAGKALPFHQLMTAAIDQRMGARYSWGATGPSAFDCSGFVWSTFKAAGVDFERSSARSLWARFMAPAEDDKFKFGTLVFFSNLTHIGIVADEKGFYHASRHHGVVYSPFNEYWMSRIDGFRRVPLPAQPTTTD